MAINAAFASLPFSLCCYVTTSKSATGRFFDDVARLARLLLRNQSFSSIKRKEKKEELLVVWRSDKTFMITRVFGGQTQKALIELVAYS